MRRREFITLIGGTSLCWLLAARAQQPPTPVIGFLRSASLADATNLVAAFRQGLRDIGYVEGQNVVIEYLRSTSMVANPNSRLNLLSSSVFGR